MNSTTNEIGEETDGPSARNRLPGNVTRIHKGEVMAEVAIAVGEQRLGAGSSLTRRAA